MNELSGKRILVIGGSSGIGLRVAELAAEQGAKLTLAGRNAERLAQAKTALAASGAEVETVILDAHDHAALEAFFAETAAFDHAVSMVGDVMGGGFLSADMATIRRVMESKFFTNVLIGKLAATKLNAGGSLIFTSGTGGRAQDACASYTGNLGIQALVEGLAVELAPDVRVNTVAPTWTPTPFWRDMPPEQFETIRQRFETSIPLHRVATIDELASAYIFLMSNTFITGQKLAVDGGIMLG
ncbi:MULTISPECIES: SDR family oxidoreductase [Rahnella]|uniref:SDR family oxidoreductase n=1 Tax=Rahnella laticis TaxID=2787622 RepID=A0ABS0E609_9GAMM|nr:MULTISPECIES: SDR family oxidoreductase [Rahnella]MBF7978689.1 SDR family oxidoreductase [Rahnella laticis]MBF7998779.1 SDR family oxidoreductase [Rahnella sp. LAC-M12]